MQNLLVDVGANLVQFVSSSRFRPFFLCFYFRTDKIYVYSLPKRHVNYLNAKKLWFACQYSLTSSVLHQNFWNCCSSLAFTPQNQSNFNIKKSIQLKFYFLISYVTHF